jgi:prepilin-type N-terminal cleavage/methylation domain-containing protein
MFEEVRRTARATASLLDAPENALKRDAGFTLIEVVMATAILLTVLTAVMATISYATSGSMDAQMRQGALNLANLRIEQAHALPYASVGTTMGASLTGSPAGTLPAVETTGAYVINTAVRYAVDPATHKQSYKIVHVDVTWSVPNPGKVTVESAVIGGETLTGSQVLISAVDLDDASVDVPGALITLDPSGGAPNQQVTTDLDGNALFGSINAGAVVVQATLANYMADLKPFAGKIINAGLNQWTMSLQEASSATIHTQLTNGTDVTGAVVSLTCTDTSHAAAFTTTQTVDSNAEAYYPNLWEIKNVGYSYLVKVIPPGNATGSVITTTFPMPSGGLNQVINVNVANTWLDVHVTDQAAGWDVDTAVVSYTCNGVAGTKTATTDMVGHAYFADLAPGYYVFTANKTYSTAPILRTGSSSKTMVTGYNTLSIQTNRN